MEKMSSRTPHTVIKNPRITTTLRYMKQFAIEGAKNLDIRFLVEQICKELEPGDYSSEILACCYWVCKNVRYMRDIDRVELLKTSQRTLDTRNGDCDDIATLLGSMLISCGNRVRFTIDDMNGGAVPNYTHVFTQVFIPGQNKWVTMDPVAGRESEKMHKRTKYHKFINI